MTDTSTTSSFTSTFLLDKPHFQECYQESAIVKQGVQAYFKAILLFVIGMLAASIAQQYKSLALFIIVLSVIEALSVYFAKTWWVWRQLLSKVANTKVTLTIDKKGIAAQSVNLQLEISWQQITNVVNTKQGLIICYHQGRYYLSKKHLSADAIAFINQQVNA